MYNETTGVLKSSAPADGVGSVFDFWSSLCWKMDASPPNEWFAVPLRFFLLYAHIFFSRNKWWLWLVCLEAVASHFVDAGPDAVEVCYCGYDQLLS